MIEGRWGQPSPDHDPQLPWSGGAAAATLVEALEPLFCSVEQHDLTSSELLWGKKVTDERYAVIATV